MGSSNSIINKQTAVSAALVPLIHIDLPFIAFSGFPPRWFVMFSFIIIFFLQKSIITIRSINPNAEMID